MARPSLFENNQYLGDRRTQVVHDLDGLLESCHIDELLEARQFATFGPDILPEARNRGYRPHRCVAGA